MIEMPAADVDLADSSVVELMRAITRFDQWRTATGREAPNWALDLPDYMVAMVDAGAAMTYAQAQTSMLRAEARRRGLEAPRLGATIRRLRRRLAFESPEQLRRRQAPALLPEHIGTILHLIDRHNYGHGVPLDYMRLRDRALVLVTWGGALRYSEAAALQLAHVTLREQGAELYLPRSKADQTGKGATVAIARHRDKAKCAVAHLERIMEHANSDGALWCRRPQGHALTPRTVRHTLQRWAASVLDGATSHSYRAGWITTAAMARVSDSAIMAHSRHRDLATAQGYIRRATVWDAAATLTVTARL